MDLYTKQNKRRRRNTPDEVRVRGRHFPAFFRERCRKTLARGDDFAAVFLHPARIGQRGFRDGLRQHVHVVGVLDLVEVADERFVPHEDADAEPGDLRGFLLDIADYVLENGVALQDGETIGFGEDQRLSITRSAGVWHQGMTLKIQYAPMPED